ncbi:MAG: hypothetical protein RR450_03480, partial [Oscillospiraceae bacterium]
IVIAIIGVLVAIAIPVFSAQLNSAKQAVDDANLRSATSMAVVDYMTNHPDGNGGVLDYIAYGKTAGDATSMKVATSKPADYVIIVGQVSTNKKMTIQIGVGGEVISSLWANS